MAGVDNENVFICFVVFVLSAVVAGLCLLTNWDVTALVAREGMDSLPGQPNAGIVRIGLFAAFAGGLCLATVLYAFVAGWWERKMLLNHLRSNRTSTHIELTPRDFEGVMADDVTVWPEGFDPNVANFQGRKIIKQSFVQPNFEGANFAGAEIIKTKFDRANFEGANFAGAKIIKTNFEGANFEGANFTGVIADKLTQWPEGFDPKAAGVIIE